MAKWTGIVSARRGFLRRCLIVCLLALGGQQQVMAADATETSAGLKETLTRGADSAVAQLGKPNGFLGDPRVRIPLPESARSAEKMMRTLGMKKQADELIETMNRAAELAVVEAKPILVDAVKKMTVSDAKAILAGGEDSATQYLNKSSREQIRAKFLPIVKQATDKVGVAQQYNSFAGQAAALGVVDAKSANVENYVTEKALDGLFKMIAEQEASIRQNPAGAATSLAKKVFGAL